MVLTSEYSIQNRQNQAKNVTARQSKANDLPTNNKTCLDKGRESTNMCFVVDATSANNRLNP